MTNPLMAALDRAGIEHRDLIGQPTIVAHAEILRRLRAAGFDGDVTPLVTPLTRVAAMIDEWAALRAARRVRG